MLWVKDGSIPACLILHSVVSPFPWLPGELMLCPSRMGSAGTDAHNHPRLALTFSAAFWKRRAELILSLFHVLSHLLGVVLGRGNAEDERMEKQIGYLGL